MPDFAKLFSLKRAARGWVALQLLGEDALICQIAHDGERPRVLWVRQVRRSDLPAWRKEHKLASWPAITVLDTDKCSLLQVEAPAVPRTEWKAALQWQLKDLIQFPVESAVIDVVEIPTEEFAPGRQQQCYLAAAPSDLVMAAVAPFCDAGFNMLAVDVPEMTQRNIGALFEEENRAQAFLAFDAGGALLTLSFHGELYAFRRIDVPMTHLSSGDEFRRQQALDRVALETQRTLDGFDRQYSFMAVSRLVLAAPPDVLPALRDVLANSMYVPLVDMDLGTVLDLSAVPELADPAQQLHYLQVIGAALRKTAE